MPCSHIVNTIIGSNHVNHSSLRKGCIIVLGFVLRQMALVDLKEEKQDGKRKENTVI